MKHALFAATNFTGVALASSAMAQDVDVKIGFGIPLSPGLTETSPGQTFISPGQVNNTARSTNPSALPPGQLFLQNQTSSGPGASTGLPPGQTFVPPGQTF